MTDSPDQPATAPDAPAARARARTAGLSGLLLPELQALAGQLGITGVARMRKGQLVEAIEERQAPRGAAATAAPEQAAPEQAAPEQAAPEQDASEPPAPAQAALDLPAAGDAEPAPRVRRTRRASAPVQTPAERPQAPVEDAAGEAASAQAAATGQAEDPRGGEDAQRPGTDEGRTRVRRPARVAVDEDASPEGSGQDRRPSRAEQERSEQERSEPRGPQEEPDSGREAGPEGEQQDDGPRLTRAERARERFLEREARRAARAAADGDEDGGARREDRGRSQDQEQDRDRAGARDQDRGGARERDRDGDRDRDRDRDREQDRDERTGRGQDRQDRARDDRDRQDRARDDRDRQDRQDRQDRARDDRDERDGDDEDGTRRGRFRERGRRRGRDRFGGAEGEPVVSEDDVLIPVGGIVDVLENYAFLRTTGYLTGPSDVYVSLQQVRRYGLRRGDAVTGAVRQQREGERRDKYNALVRLDTINGMDPEEARTRPDFQKLTPLYPQERLRLETEPQLLTTRVIDLVMPLGKGQRALVVSPPKAGKTMVLQAIANAITKNNPECHLMVVLVDERPEEVTDMQRSVKGEVIASTFDRPPTDHITVAELSIERAKRLVELGHDVVVLLDSITRLGRAYNLGAPPSGRILTGGVDAAALYPPKRFLGAARNIENGGSLTIIATALVETGSAMDSVIFEEFKGTGNAELKLDRRLADKRLFPAVDVDASGTRKEELLLAPEEQRIVHQLRRVLHGLESGARLELLLDKMRTTRTNVEFLMQISKTTVPAAKE